MAMQFSISSTTGTDVRMIASSGQTTAPSATGNVVFVPAAPAPKPSAKRSHLRLVRTERTD